jgi:hypothetical protein|eukprot:SAG25_NODE_726_length_5711_cov_2.408411_6_plen_83_part_00
MPASRSRFTFPSPGQQRQQRRAGVGGAQADELVDSLVSRFDEINTAFDHNAAIARFVEVAKQDTGSILSPEDAHQLLEGASA